MPEPETTAPVAGGGDDPKEDQPKTMSDHEIEGQKALMEFSKVVLTFSSTVMVAYIGYHITQGRSRDVAHLWPLGLLVLSALCSLYGFGRSIGNLRSGEDKGRGILASNVGAFLLFGALIVALFFGPSKRGFPEALKGAVDELQESGIAVTVDDLKSCERDGDALTARFEKDGNVHVVTYDVAHRSIVKMEAP